MILIIGSEEEAHSKYMKDELCKRGYDAIYLDSRKYPKSISLSYCPNANDGYFIIDCQKIDFKSITGVYWRWFYGVVQGDTDDAQVNNIIFRERNSALMSVFKSLKCNWVNSYNAIELHKVKAHQLKLMSYAGIKIPKTLITSDKDALLEFYEKNNKNIIYKPVLGGALTEKITDKDLAKEKLDTLCNCPILLQEFVNGTDVRVYVLGNKIFAAEIRANTIDFRGDDNANIVPIELPKKIQDDCKKVVKILGLAYSGIDIKRTENNEYYFIEANPAPMFIHFENMTHYPITESLIELLVK